MPEPGGSQVTGRECPHEIILACPQRPAHVRAGDRHDLPGGIGERRQGARRRKVVHWDA
jgi:hypothetical protein